MNIGTRIGIVSGESIINNLKIHYDVSNASNLYSDVNKTTNPILDGGASTGVIKSFKNLASSSSRDSIQIGSVDVLYQSDPTDAGAYFDINSHHNIPNISTLKDFQNVTFIFVLKLTAGTNRYLASNGRAFNIVNGCTLLVNTTTIDYRSSPNLLVSTSSIPGGNKGVLVYSIDIVNKRLKTWMNLISNEITYTQTLPTGFGQSIDIGGYPLFEGNGIRGYLYELKIYNNVLTDNEVRTEIQQLDTKWNIGIEGSSNQARLTDGIIGGFVFGDGTYFGVCNNDMTFQVYTFLSNVIGMKIWMLKDEAGSLIFISPTVVVNGVDVPTFTDTVESTSGAREIIRREFDITNFVIGTNNIILRRNTFSSCIFISEIELIRSA